MILAGCPTETQAWLLLLPLLAYTALAVSLVARPDHISNDWPPLGKRLFAAALVAIGVVLMTLEVYTGVTGECPGVDS